MFRSSWKVCGGGGGGGVGWWLRPSLGFSFCQAEQYRKIVSFPSHCKYWGRNLWMDLIAYLVSSDWNDQTRYWVMLQSEYGTTDIRLIIIPLTEEIMVYEGLDRDNYERKDYFWLKIFLYLLQYILIDKRTRLRGGIIIKKRENFGLFPK